MVKLHTPTTLQGWSVKLPGKRLCSDWPLCSFLKGRGINSFILTGWKGICSGHVIKNRRSEPEDCSAVSNSAPSLRKAEAQRGNPTVTQELGGRSEIGSWISWLQGQCSFYSAIDRDTVKFHLTTNCVYSQTPADRIWGFLVHLKPHAQDNHHTQSNSCHQAPLTHGKDIKHWVFSPLLLLVLIKPNIFLHGIFTPLLDRVN